MVVPGAHPSTLTHERRRDLSPQGHPRKTDPPALAAPPAPLARPLVLTGRLWPPTLNTVTNIMNRLIFWLHRKTAIVNLHQNLLIIVVNVNKHFSSDAQTCREFPTNLSDILAKFYDFAFQLKTALLC